MIQKYRQELVQLLAQMRPAALMDAFLQDLLTPVEFDDIAMRWQIVKQLARGVPQREIAKNLGVSIATITRGSRELQDKKGGFRQVLNSTK